MNSSQIMESIIEILVECVPYSLAWGLGVTVYNFVVGELTGRRYRNNGL